MNIKALRTFSMIIGKGTLTAAAEVLCISESAASRQISVLESELGFKLFSREKRNLRPTHEGAEFYREVERILYSLEGLPEIARSIRKGRKSTLRLVTVPRLVRHIISPVVKRMCEETPELNIKIDVQGMRYLQRWIAGFQFHLGLGRLPAENPAIKVHPFFSLPTMVLMPRGHRLANRSELTLEDLHNEPIITLLQETLLRKNLEQIYQAAGLPLPYFQAEVATAHQAACIVATGLGVTVADPLVAHNLGTDELDMVPLKTDLRHDYAFFEPANTPLTANGQLFIDYVKEESTSYLQRYGYDHM